ncbi:MAG: ArsR family transcriptional regulator [Pseudomonadales bacterium]
MSDSSSQDKILYQLKRLGPLTAREIGTHLGITTMGTRQHLAQLESEALVTTTPEESRGRGHCETLETHGPGHKPSQTAMPR